MPQTKPFGADIASNTDITVNNAIVTTKLGIGTAAPNNALHISDQNNLGFKYEQYSDVDGANLRNYRARGTKTAPTGLLAGDRIAGLTAFGYHSSNAFSTVVGNFSVYAQEDFTSGAQGTYLKLETANSGGTGISEKVRITANGNVGIGTTTPAYPLDIGNTTGAITTAKFGQNLSLYAVQANPTLGFNAYYNAGWKYGAGSTNSFGGSIDVGPTTGAMSFNVTSAVGNTGGAATMVAIMYANTTGLTPGTSNTYDLGTSSLRWRNIYTNDLHLSNGIGDYTVVEGEEDLFLYNNKSGKTFKFALIEVDPASVPKKAKD